MRHYEDLRVEDTCRMYVRSEAGAMGSIDLSWSLHKERDSYIELFGPEGVLSIGWQCSKYRQSEKLDWVKFGNGYNKFAAMGGQLRNFANTIRGREMPLITPEASIESVKVIEAAYHSMSMNKWVDVGSHQAPVDLSR